MDKKYKVGLIVTGALIVVVSIYLIFTVLNLDNKVFADINFNILSLTPTINLNFTLNDLNIANNIDLFTKLKLNS